MKWEYAILILKFENEKNDFSLRKLEDTLQKKGIIYKFNRLNISRIIEFSIDNKIIRVFHSGNGVVIIKKPQNLEKEIEEAKKLVENIVFQNDS